MATANSALRIAELDFDGIRSNLITFLRGQTQFQDYDFDGSGMSVLIDLLAYNTHYMAYYLNMVGNEMFLDTAQMRSSVVSHAKHINYVPGSARGATAIVDLTITPEGSEDTATGTFTLPKYTRFVSEPLDGISYIFSTTSANTAVKSGGSFHYHNLEIRQGEPAIQYYSVNGQTRFNIPSSNVDTDTVTVTVQASPSNTVTNLFTLADDLTEIGPTSEIFFLEENSDVAGQYTISFGDGILGKQVTDDNIIQIRYMDTHGEYANKTNTFISASSIGGYSANVRVTSLSRAAGGRSKETVEEIRKRAPIAYTVQNRAVTKNDYQTLLLEDYPNIDTISVWSGDENDPPVYGKVFISMKPEDGYYISLLEKERIKDEIIANRSVLTVTPEIVDPDYTYMLLNVTVNYSPDLTTLDETELKQLVRQAILDYRESDLQSFNSTFRMSRLQKAIDNAHECIRGSSVRIYLQKRKDIVVGEDKIYSMDFGTPIYRGVIEDKFYTYPEMTVLDTEGTERSIYFEDTPNSLSGIDSIRITASGSEYLTNPTVTITGDGNGATAIARITNGKVSTIEVENRGTDYTTATVEIEGDTGSGATAIAQLEAKNGTLRSFYYKSTGEKVVVNSDVGSIDYVKGRVIINSLNPLEVAVNDRYSANVATFNAVPYDDVIPPQRNRILDIDTGDSGSIFIKMVPEI